MIVAGLKEDSILPALLQLDLTSDVKDAIRAEIEEAIGGEAGRKDDADARAAAIVGQNRSFIGLKSEPLLGSKMIKGATCKAH